MELKYTQKIAEKLSLTLKQVTSVHDLQAEGRYHSLYGALPQGSYQTTWMR